MPGFILGVVCLPPLRNCAFANYTNILNVIEAIKAIKTKPDYANLRIAY